MHKQNVLAVLLTELYCAIVCGMPDSCLFCEGNNRLVRASLHYWRLCSL